MPIPLDDGSMLMTNRPHVVSLDSRRTVAWISILSFPVSLAAMYTFMAMVSFNDELTGLPTSAIGIIKTDYLAAWGFFDILGYYLMRIPLLVLLWHWLRPKAPVAADIATVFGLFYLLLSIVAASMLTGAATGIATHYAAPDPAARTSLEAAWTAAVSTAYSGVWHYDLLPWSVWGLTIGSLLKTQHRWLGLGLQLIGLAALLNVVIIFVPEQVRGLFAIAGDFQVHFSSLWVVWAGIVLLRKTPHQ